MEHLHWIINARNWLTTPVPRERKSWPVALGDLAERVPTHPLHATSAASGDGVGEAFERLARRTLEERGGAGRGGAGRGGRP